MMLFVVNAPSISMFAYDRVSDKRCKSVTNRQYTATCVLSRNSLKGDVKAFMYSQTKVNTKAKKIKEPVEEINGKKFQTIVFAYARCEWPLKVNVNQI